MDRTLSFIHEDLGGHREWGMHPFLLFSQRRSLLTTWDYAGILLGKVGYIVTSASGLVGDIFPPRIWLRGDEMAMT